MDRFLDELNQQPDAIRAVTSYFLWGEGKRILESAASCIQSEKCTQIIITGMGSSYFMACAALSMFPESGTPVCAMESGELLHENYGRVVSGTLLVVISQSGESYEVKTLLEHLRRDCVSLAGVIGITNNIGSSLAQVCDICLPLSAGDERMTSSKTFVNTYIVLLALAELLRGERLSEETFLRIADEVGNILSGSESVAKAAKVISDSVFVQCISRGVLKSVADQTALMLMEVCKLPSSSLSGGAFRHGPIEAVGQSFTVVLFTHTCSGTYRQAVKLASDILSYGGKLILVSDCQSDIRNENLTEIVIHCTDLRMAVPLYILPLQLVADRVALNKGIVPGAFVHGNKVTAIE